MKAIIQKELGIPIVEISDQTAIIDGGDVLFTGDENIKLILNKRRLLIFGFGRKGILCWYQLTNEPRRRPRTSRRIPRISMHSCQGIY